MIVKDIGAASLPGSKRASHGNKSENEDRYIYNLDLGYVAVFDGHGGELCAEYLRSNVDEALKGAMEREALDSDDSTKSAEDDQAKAMERILLDTFETLEDEFQMLAGKTRDSSGACATICLFRNKTCYVGYCGDCRLVLREMKFGSSIPGPPSYSTYQSTTDHRVDVPGSERERVIASGGSIRNGRIGPLMPSRCIGDRDVKSKLGDGIVSSTPEICSFNVYGHMLLVVGTDGLYDFLSNKAILNIAEDAAKSDSCAKAAQKLCKAARKRGDDDSTAVVVLLQAK
mmetsp:Transcript_7341/g.13246  ORF Transcript_7341/g.13246 Transcript_7341/m.13246 type:complete len:286 (-) Transcript_7341:1278-2135(-)